MRARHGQRRRSHLSVVWGSTPEPENTVCALRYGRNCLVVMRRAGGTLSAPSSGPDPLPSPPPLLRAPSPPRPRVRRPLPLPQAPSACSNSLFLTGLAALCSMVTRCRWMSAAVFSSSFSSSSCWWRS